ncbi:MAG: glycoside hydrolase family 19 protein [Methylococcales bacterium]
MMNEQLDALGIDHKWLEPLEETFAKYEINTPQRQACFIGQCAHESGNFKILQENLNYSAEGLMKTWPSRFPTKEIADQYARQPAKIAGKVYNGRLGNTSEEEAAKYLGRGLIQLTGKENYEHCGSNLGVDLLGNPDWLSDPKYAALSAGWFWNKKGLNSLADAQDIETMTKRINGGLIGLDDRKAKITKALSVLG